ncbi:MAG: sulfite exporter TauE/SafE family protein [Ignavibacteriaceae bacterium]|nr:sulfite exporter TauE/SafE family protein [Ignavibacteriaceae bacterium]
MSELVVILIFAVLGFGAGILVGLVGIGGGIIFVPVLYYFLPYTSVNLSQISFIVIGTSLFAGSIAASSSGLNHILIKNFDLKKTLYLAIGSILTSIVLPKFVVSFNPAFIKWFFVFLILIVAIRLFFDKNHSEESGSGLRVTNWFLVLLGIFVGAISAFAGIGGGIMYVPILFYLAGVPFRKAIGSSSILAAITMISLSISFGLLNPPIGVVDYQVGYVYLLAGLPLGLFAALGSIIGVKLVVKSRIHVIKRVFAIILVIAVIKIVF